MKKKKFRTDNKMQTIRAKGGGRKVAIALSGGKARVIKGPKKHIKGPITAPVLLMQKRRTMAANLRVNGLSYSEIARTIRNTHPELCPKGYGRDSARMDVQHYTATIDQSAMEKIQQMREIELMRLDWLTMLLGAGIRDKAIPIMSKIKLELIDRYVKVSELRAKMAGLHAPVQVDHTLFGDIQINFGFDGSQYDDVIDEPEAYDVTDYHYTNDDEEEIQSEQMAITRVIQGDGGPTSDDERLIVQVE